MYRCECRVAWQTDGATPVFIASQNGHVECVRALLGSGAAINQAMVGHTSSMARRRVRLCAGHCGSLRACLRLQLVGCAGVAHVGGMGER
jgi:hypothetical protein